MRKAPRKPKQDEGQSVALGGNTLWQERTGLGPHFPPTPPERVSLPPSEGGRRSSCALGPRGLPSTCGNEGNLALGAPKTKWVQRPAGHSPTQILKKWGLLGLRWDVAWPPGGQLCLGTGPSPQSSPPRPPAHTSEASSFQRVPGVLGSFRTPLLSPAESSHRPCFSRASPTTTHASFSKSPS